jgi:hypothetical protein
MESITMPSTTVSSSDGVINADALYTLPEIQQRLGLGVHAMRMARRAGLRVKYVGRKGFILGRDLIAHVEANGKTVK